MIQVGDLVPTPAGEGSNMSEPHPGRTTWAPTDQEEPVPAPAEVVDGEGETWTRTGNGTWYMLSFNPATCEDERDADYLTWRELVDEYGPLTSHARTR